jgi:hypothetical protein
MSDSDSDSIISYADPISETDLKLLEEFNIGIQNAKEELYDKTVRQQKETTDGTNLDGLHKYEIALYHIGNDLLKGVYGLAKTPSEITPPALWRIITATPLSSDVRIEMEDKIRRQFIQYPMPRWSESQ